MKLWEYQAVAASKMLTTTITELNTQGFDGWELVYIDNEAMYFKRELIKPICIAVAKDGTKIFDDGSTQPWDGIKEP